LGKCFAGLWNKSIQREEVFLTSKLWVTKMSPQLVEAACRQSLKEWGVQYFDLYLIHYPFAFKSNATGSILYDEQGRAVLDESVSLQDTWRAMEQLAEKGLVRAIGVSNFSVSLLQRLLDMPDPKIKPTVNQVELHPYLPQAELREFCDEQGIVVEAYSSLGSGGEPSLMEDPTLLEVAAEEKISNPAVVLLSWARQQGIPVIPKSSHRERIAANFSNHALSQSSMDRINAIQKRHRYIDPMNFWKHPMPK